MQKIAGVEQINNRVYSDDRYVATAVIDVMVVKGSLQLSSMHLVSVTKSVLPILDLVDFDFHFGVLVALSNCFKTTDIHSSAQIVPNGLYDLGFVILHQV